MDSRSIRLLELNKIIDMLGQACATAMGVELAAAVVPRTEPDIVDQLLRQTAEAVAVLSKDSPPFSGLTDVRDDVVRAGKQGVLDASQLHRIGVFLTGSKKLKRHVLRLGEQDSFLWLAAQGLVELEDLAKSLAAAVDNDGNVLDSASTELRGIRRRLENGRAKLRDKLDSMVKSPAIQKHLQESLVTQRNGRFCLPVKSESKAQVPGVVHDQSASGATLFVEPMAVVDINNDLARMQREEEQEMFRILSDLSLAVGRHVDEIIAAVQSVADLDLVFARGKLALSMNAVKPEVDQALFIDKGRHPLLPQDEVVPITVGLGGEFTSLVITGPNTGGKTVTLKTIGLFCLMAQCGLWVPARQCTVPVYKGIYADIGDEQSIEQSLSTFSSHMTSIVSILKEADDKSLVLLDELGAGTDPVEGAALATSLLDYFREKGTSVVATTHYSELKEYAWTEPGVQNASVEFDVETLRPTYRLLMGTPGKSNAFEIARRLGLPEDVVKGARQRMQGDSRRVEDMLASLEAKRLETEKHLTVAREKKLETDKVLASYQKRLDQLRKEREKLLERARQKANEVVVKARQEADQLLAELRQASTDANTTELERQIRERLKPTSASGQTAHAPGQAPDKDSLKPGQRVRVVSLDKVGNVAGFHGNQVVVQIGIIKANVDSEDLRVAAAAPREEPAKGVAKVDSSQFSPRLDLRGMQVEEAIASIDQFLDRAVLAGMEEVSLIHGKGTGALGKGIQKWLKGHSAISEFRFGGAGEGGTGATIVRLKK